MNDKSLGIYCQNTKKFYYLETGKVPVGNTITRLRRTLIQRRIIKFDEKAGMNTSDYKILSCRDARIEELEMVPIYISNHIKNQTTGEEKKEPSGIWGSES